MPGFLYKPLADLGIYKLGGEGFDEDIKTICANESAELCDYVKAFDDSVAYSTKTGEHFA